MSSYLAGLLFLDVMTCKKVEQECLQELVQIQNRLLGLQIQQEAQTARINRKQMTRDGMRERAAQYVADRRQGVHNIQPGGAAPKTGTANQNKPAPVLNLRASVSVKAVYAGNRSKDKQLKQNKEAAVVWRSSAKQEVSLRAKKQEDLQEQVWQAFLKRIQRLKESKNPTICRCAEELEEEQKQCLPMGRKTFLQAQGSRLAELEEQEKLFCKKQAEKQEQIARYRALCKLLEQQPDPVILADDDMCRRQTEEMWKQYSQRRQHIYMIQTLQEVFARHSIPIQIAQEDAPEVVALCPLGRNAHLVVTYHGSGAFEMEVEGICAAQEPTEDEKREVLEQAVAFCKRYPEIERDLVARGVHLTDRISRDAEKLLFCSNAEPEQNRFDTVAAHQVYQEG